VSAREVETRSPEETEAVGEALGRSAAGGNLIGLVGDLGAGKTCFVRGLARGLGIDPDRVHSPSFTIVTEYPGGRLTLSHVDLYRLEPPVADDGFLREVLHDDGVAAVEWFDRLAAGGEDEMLLVTFRFTAQGRAIRLEPRGRRHEELLAHAAVA
jgi:tRNA threonylcarbamoyladenosine biosynthesis protein TsaE